MATRVNVVIPAFMGGLLFYKIGAYDAHHPGSVISLTGRMFPPLLPERCSVNEERRVRLERDGNTPRAGASTNEIGSVKGLISLLR
jgi:hypothetical protein